MTRSTDLVAAALLQCAVLPRLRDKEQLRRFSRARSRYAAMCDVLGASESAAVLEGAANEGYDWGVWRAAIRRAFEHSVPLHFLWQPEISRTMVFGRLGDLESTRTRIELLTSVYPEPMLMVMLREDYIGLPKISSARYSTSPNRAHHASHLASYTKRTGRSVWDANQIVEWGGGYGDMARIIRRMNPDITYVIIDLPELCALQHVYLQSVEGEDSVNTVTPGTPLVPRKVNLVPVDAVLSGQVHISGDTFVSTWALSESPRGAQEFVAASAFFDATNILMAYMVEEHNCVRDAVSDAGCKLVPIDLLGGSNEYAFR